MGPPAHINGTGLWAVRTVGAKISGDHGKDEINYLLNSVSPETCITHDPTYCLQTLRLQVALFNEMPPARFRPTGEPAPAG